MDFPGPKTAKQIRPHLHRFLRWRLAIYLAVAISVGAFVIYDAYRNSIPGIFAAVGVFIGLCLGYAASRIHKIYWSDRASKVIARMDMLGIFILVVYLSFELHRRRIVGSFVGDADAAVTSFSILAGIMYGRVLGIRGNVVRVLKEHDLLGKDL